MVQQVKGRRDSGVSFLAAEAALVHLQFISFLLRSLVPPVGWVDDVVVLQSCQLVLLEHLVVLHLLLRTE